MSSDAPMALCEHHYEVAMRLARRFLALIVEDEEIHPPVAVIALGAALAKCCQAVPEDAPETGAKLFEDAIEVARIGFEDPMLMMEGRMQ